MRLIVDKSLAAGFIPNNTWLQRASLPFKPTQGHRLQVKMAYPQSDQSLCQSLEYSMSVKLLTEHHLEFISLTGGCTDLSESFHVKMPHCWKSHHGSFVHASSCHPASLLGRNYRVLHKYMQHGES